MRTTWASASQLGLDKETLYSDLARISLIAFHSCALNKESGGEMRLAA